MSRLPVLFVALCAAVLTGCVPGSVQGRVVRAQGSLSAVTVASSSDARCTDGAGLSGVTVRLRSRPGELRSRDLGSAVTDADGRFRIKVRPFFDELLMGDICVFVRASGFSPAYGEFSLPSSSERVLIFFAPGADRPQPGLADDDASIESDRFWQ